MRHFGLRRHGTGGCLRKWGKFRSSYTGTPPRALNSRLPGLGLRHALPGVGTSQGPFGTHGQCRVAATGGTQHAHHAATPLACTSKLAMLPRFASVRGG